MCNNISHIHHISRQKPTVFLRYHISFISIFAFFFNLQTEQNILNYHTDFTWFTLPGWFLISYYSICEFRLYVQKSLRSALCSWEERRKDCVHQYFIPVSSISKVIGMLIHQFVPLHINGLYTSFIMHFSVQAGHTIIAIIATMVTPSNWFYNSNEIQFFEAVFMK